MNREINAAAFSGESYRSYAGFRRFPLLLLRIMYGFYTCLPRVLFVSIAGRQMRTWYDFGTKEVRLWWKGKWVGKWGRNSNDFLINKDEFHNLWRLDLEKLNR